MASRVTPLPSARAQVVGAWVPAPQRLPACDGGSGSLHFHICSVVFKGATSAWWGGGGLAGVSCGAPDRGLPCCGSGPSQARDCPRPASAAVGRGGFHTRVMCPAKARDCGAPSSRMEGHRPDAPLVCVSGRAAAVVAPRSRVDPDGAGEGSCPHRSPAPSLASAAQRACARPEPTPLWGQGPERPRPQRGSGLMGVVCADRKSVV